MTFFVDLLAGAPPTVVAGLGWLPFGVAVIALGGILGLPRRRTRGTVTVARLLGGMFVACVTLGMIAAIAVSPSRSPSPDWRAHANTPVGHALLAGTYSAMGGLICYVLLLGGVATLTWGWLGTFLGRQRDRPLYPVAAMAITGLALVIAIEFS